MPAVTPIRPQRKPVSKPIRSLCDSLGKGAFCGLSSSRAKPGPASGLGSRPEPAVEQSRQVLRIEGFGQVVVEPRRKIGGAVVDTPGIREFGLWRIGREELRACFPDFAEASGRCRFGDCSHLVEPGCGVQSAVREGSVAAARYDSYRRLAGSLST